MVATPLTVAPTYWREMVASRAGAAPSISSLYAEARALLLPGLRQSALLARAGTLELWEALATCSFRGTAMSFELPRGWDLGYEAPEHAGTSFRIRVRERSDGFRRLWTHTLELSPAPNWLSTRKGPHLLSLLRILMPTALRLRTGRCPFCDEGPPQVTWSHVLCECDAFWAAHVAAELHPWRPLIEELGLGIALSGASTRLLPVLRLAAAQLYEECEAREFVAGGRPPD